MRVGGLRLTSDEQQAHGPCLLSSTPSFRLLPSSLTMPPRKQRISLPSKKKKSRAPTYETFDEALDGGVEQEEKGERYRVGDKVGR